MEMMMRQYNVRRLVYIGFTAALIIFGIVVYYTYTSIKELLATDADVTHTYAVHENIDTIFTLLSDLQSKTQDYAITGDSSFILSHNHVISLLQNKKSDLAQLTAGDPIQEKNFTALSDAIPNELSVLEETVFLRETPHNDFAPRLASLIRHGKITMDSVHAALGRMKDVESGLSKKQRELADKSDMKVINALGYGTTIGVILFIAAFVFLSVDTEQDKKLRNALYTMNDELEERIHKRTAELRSANENLRKEINDRLRAEEKLREEHLFSNMLLQAENDIGIGIAVTRDTQIIYTNSALSGIFGLTADELKNLPNFFALIVPEERKRLLKILRENAAARTDFSNTDETIIHRKNGERVNIEYSAKGVRIGGQTYMFSAVRNITERKIEETRHRHIEASLAEAQRIAHLGNWDLDLSHQENLGENAVTWSDEVFRIFGYQPGEILPFTREKFFQFVHPKDRDALDKSVREYIAGGARYSVDYRIRRPDGTERVVHEEADLVRDETTGHPLRLVGIVQDITARTKMERQLEQYYQQVQSIIENVDVVLMSFDIRHNRALLVSPTCQKVYGYPQEEFYSDILLWKKIRHPDDQKAVEAAENLIAEGIPIDDEYRIIRADGEIRWVHGKWKPTLDGEGNVVRIDGYVNDVTERKEEEEHLRKSEASLELAQRMTHLGNWSMELTDLHDFRNNKAEWSDEVFRIFGYKPGEIAATPETFYRAVHPEDLPNIMETDRAYLSGGPRINRDFRIVRPDGVVRIVHTEADILKSDGTNAPARLVGIVQDITERKQEEERLRHSEANLAEAQHIAHLGSWEMNFVDYDNINANKVQWSDEVYRIFGYKPGEIELTRETFRSLIHPDDIERLDMLAQRYLSGATGHSISYRIIRPDGSERVAHENANIVFDNTTRKPLRIMGTVQDVTEYVQMEEQLRQSNEQMQNIIDNTDAVLFSIDLVNYRILQMSAACEKIYGRSVNEFRNDLMLWKKVIHPDDLPMVEASEKNDHLGIIRRDEYRIIRPDGSIRWIGGTIKPVLGKNGKLIRVDGFMSDITERKEAEENIRRSLEEKEVLLKEIHHRVKNNMQVISSMVNLQEEFMQDPHDKDAFRDTQNRIKSMALVHEMLYQSEDLAKIDFDFYLRTIVQQLLESYLPDPDRIELEVQTNDIHLDVDAAIPCGLIINELVSNSLKYAFPGKRKGNISVVFAKDGKGGFSFAVSDNGIGLPKDVGLGHSSTLGLQLVDTLVHQLGGNIDISRDSGTTFRVNFIGAKKAA